MDKTRILLVVFCTACMVYLGRSQEDCHVKILEDSSEVFVPYNTSRWLNCSYSCQKTIWKTRLGRNNVSGGPNWVAVNVEVDDWEESKANCIYTSANKSITEAFIIVKAYVLAKNVTIDLQRELEEGKKYNVTCIAHNVAPVRNLRISVTRGGKVIHSKTYENDTSTPEENNLPTVTETFGFTASREDNLQDIACQAILELGNIPNTTVQSPSIPVRTFALPEDPHITVDTWIEQGTSATVFCLASNAFPPQNITLQMMFDETPDTRSVHVSTINASLILETSSYSLGQHSVTCISAVNGLSRESTAQVIIYEAPKVDIALSSQTVDLGSTVTANCVIANSNPDDYCVAIMVDGEERLKQCRPNLSYNITSIQSHPSISVTCLVFMKKNINISKTASERITVQNNFPVWIWIIVVVGVLIVILLVILFIYLKSKGKKGFYDLLTRSNKKGNDKSLKNGHAKQNTTSV